VEGTEQLCICSENEKGKNMEALNKKKYFVQPGEEVLISYRKEMCNRIYQVSISSTTKNNNKEIC